MCNLDKLRVAKKQLPFPEPYNLMWLKVRKIVDRLHMRNHKDPRCMIKYESDDFKEKYPHLNTPVAEQTFIWIQEDNVCHAETKIPVFLP